MIEQFARFSFASAQPRGLSPQVANHGPRTLVPGRIPQRCPEQVVMNDATQQRLSALRAKLRRIEGHKELSPKQAETATAIVREIVKLDGTDLDELSKLFE